MATTYAQTGLTPQQWDDEFFEGYIRANQFSRYMGAGEDNIIQLKDDLTKKPGDSVTFALVRELQGGGVTGNTRLKGAEEALDSRSHRVYVEPLRHGVVMTTWEEQKSAIGLRNAAKVRLKNWALNRMRSDVITALGSIDGVAYASASEGSKDTWLQNNSDRVLFGASEANAVTAAGDHSAGLATIDASADKLTPDAVSLMRMMARRPSLTYSAAIYPTRVNDDEEWYVLFCNSRAFRDLKANTAMQQAQREAWIRGENNPLWRGGDLMWDGVIIREVPEIPLTGAVGDGNAVVGPVYMTGLQAVGIAWAQRTKTATDSDDYDFENGVAISEIRGIEKLRFGTGANDTDNPVQNGVLTGYFSAAA